MNIAVGLGASLPIGLTASTFNRLQGGFDFIFLQALLLSALRRNASLTASPKTLFSITLETSRLQSRASGL